MSYEKKCLEEMFTRFDTNKDGTINTCELDKLFKSMNTPLTKLECQEAMFQLDHNRSGKIELQEFLEFMLNE